MIKFKPRTAPQILEHYFYNIGLLYEQMDSIHKNAVLKAMRHYARVKSDIAYEKGFQTALKLYNLK